MYTSTQSGNKAPTASPNRRLSRALDHVKQLWFPVNRDLCAKILKGLDEGTYELEFDYLIAELKSDFALFTFCLKELAQMIGDEKLPPTPATPDNIFRWAGRDRIKTLVRRAEEETATHDLSTASDAQILRLREAMLSAATAEVLAPEESLEADVSYAAGLLRQLGLTLIAWNYPIIYRRAIQAISKDQSLDTLLSQALGFSPNLLALALIEEWGLTADFGAELFGHAEPIASVAVEEGEAAAERRSTLAKLCRIGEALARANDPEHYPTAAGDWLTARKELEYYLGPDWVKVVGEQVKETSASYIAFMPKAFGGLTFVDPESKLHAFTERTVLKNNPFVEGLPPTLKKKIKELYLRIDPAHISRDNLRMVIKEIVPEAGFSGGCLYIFDPGTMALIPRVKIGSVVLRQLNPLTYRALATDHDPIVTAYQCHSPLMESVLTPGNERFSFITGLIGDHHKVGVIYLELPSQVNHDEPRDMLLHFKALRQLINDCLNLT